MTEKDKEINELRRRVKHLEGQHISNILNAVAVDICDHYCKYSEKYSEDEAALDPYCAKCPMNRLIW